MRWEVFYDENTNTVTVIDAPDEQQFTPPENVGASLGTLQVDPKARFIMQKGDTLLKTWLTQRFGFLGITGQVEEIQLIHLPRLY